MKNGKKERFGFNLYSSCSVCVLRREGKEEEYKFMEKGRIRQRHYKQGGTAMKGKTKDICF